MNIEIMRALNLHKEFIIQSQIDMAMESEGLEVKREIVEPAVEAVFFDPVKGYYLIATVDGGAPAGCLLVNREWSDWRNATVLWVHSVYVDPSYRKRGLFKAMYAHLKKQVEENEGLAGIRLFVDKSNEKAIKVYENLGMNGEHYHLFEWLK